MVVTVDFRARHSTVGEGASYTGISHYAFMVVGNNTH